MRALLTTLFFTLTSLTASAAADQPLIGKWVMHLYIGDRVFHDVVLVESGPDGKLGGNLSVPDVFDAVLENVVNDGLDFSFEITADEGQGPFRVRYEGRFHEGRNDFVGFAKFIDGDRLLGGFVGVRQPLK